MTSATTLPPLPPSVPAQSCGNETPPQRAPDPDDTPAYQLKPLTLQTPFGPAGKTYVRVRRDLKTYVEKHPSKNNIPWTPEMELTVGDVGVVVWPTVPTQEHIHTLVRKELAGRNGIPVCFHIGMVLCSVYDAEWLEPVDPACSEVVGDDLLAHARALVEAFHTQMQYDWDQVEPVHIALANQQCSIPARSSQPSFYAPGDVVRITNRAGGILCSAADGKTRIGTGPNHTVGRVGFVVDMTPVAGYYVVWVPHTAQSWVYFEGCVERVPSWSAELAAGRCTRAEIDQGLRFLQASKTVARYFVQSLRYMETVREWKGTKMEADDTTT